MKYRQLGRTGVWVSEIALGTMTFGGAGHPVFSTIGALGQQDVDRVVGAALDAGVNLVDTADVYADGESEELLGRALGRRRREVVLGTKLLAPMGPGPNDQGLTRLHIMRSLEDSLRRLGTDYIDLYQIHNYDRITPLEETLSALDDAVRQGKVRYLGCSNLAAWQISKAHGISARHNQARFVANQVHYSLVSRDVERDLVPMAEDSGLSITVWSPLVGGLLTGKFDRDGVAHPDTRRARAGGEEFIPYDRETAFKIVDVLRTVAARHDVSPARVAIAWLLAQRAVTSVIVGARRLDQLADNIAAGDLVLTDQDLAELDDVSRQPPSYPNWIQDAFAPVRIPA
ncbi:aldo/keto reductase [Kutzneria buriramensis]|uniref:Aryl-alcohol dehydrogenase-like predicted oxidoreductase n=1 Tax=Kutzneria buriramensis TaxID=1045776 RepID=A0A3E0H4G9_9PSEU|nr:aldo/keto reductase [Kutzneria buriramensis]REH37057.1 aryl-alcohol dehydrogenase-like predicted oxidoreductase [Kutzneria buriramensis]